MLKRDEFFNPNSCLNKAKDDELIFVLLERDIMAPEVVRGWANLRVITGKNNARDPQILEAISWADRAEEARISKTPVHEFVVELLGYKCTVCRMSPTHPIHKLVETPK